MSRFETRLDKIETMARELPEGETEIDRAFREAEERMIRAGYKPRIPFKLTAEEENQLSRLNSLGDVLYFFDEIRKKWEAATGMKWKGRERLTHTP